MVKNKEMGILVYFMQIKNKEKKEYLDNSKIQSLLDKISKLPYKRGDDNSRIKKLGDYSYSIDIEKQEKEKTHFFAGKERDANLPQKREENGTIDKIPLKPTDNLLEFSCGCFFFDKKLEEGAILLLQKNHFGCSAIRLKKYLEQIDNKKYEVSLSILTEKPSFISLIKGMKELKYIEISETNFNPIGFGDYQYAAKHPEENKVMKLKKFKIDVRDEEEGPLETLKRILKYFKITEFNEKRLREFVNEHGLKLTAIKVPSTKQEEFDLTKNLMLFSYKVKSKKDFDKEEFYKQCGLNYGKNKNRILDFTRKLIQNQ